MRMETIAEFIEVLTLQKANLTTYLAAVSCTAADVTAVTNRLNNINAVITYCDQLDAATKEAFGTKDLLIFGDTGLPIPAFTPIPAAPVLTSPASGGMKDQRKLNARIKAGPGYTDPIGDALGVGPSTAPPPDPGDVVPKINVFAAKSGYEFSVVVTGREQADSWRVDAIPVATGVRTIVGTGTGKSADFIYKPSAAEAGKPVQTRIEVQLRKNNADYGHPSDEARITVNP